MDTSPRAAGPTGAEELTAGLWVSPWHSSRDRLPPAPSGPVEYLHGGHRDVPEGRAAELSLPRVAAL